MTLKLRTNIVNPFTLPVGADEIPLGSCVILSSSALVVSTGNVAHVGIVTELGSALKDVRVAGPGSIVLCLAHDSSITEGEWVVPAASGRVDGIAAMTTIIQYPVGIALMAPSAQNVLFPVLVMPGIVTKAGS